MYVSELQFSAYLFLQLCSLLLGGLCRFRLDLNELGFTESLASAFFLGALWPYHRSGPLGTGCLFGTGHAELL